MKTIVTLVGLMCLTLPTAQGQSSEPKAFTADQKHFFHSLFMTMSGTETPVEANVPTERALRDQFGLNDSEIQVLRVAVGTLRTSLAATRVLASRILVKGTLTMQEQLTMSSLVADRDHMIESLTTDLLSKVRPSVASQLMLAGELQARFIKQR